MTEMQALLAEQPTTLLDAMDHLRRLSATTWALDVLRRIGKPATTNAIFGRMRGEFDRAEVLAALRTLASGGNVRRERGRWTLAAQEED